MTQTNTPRCVHVLALKRNPVFYTYFTSVFLCMAALFCILLCNRALSWCCCLWVTRRRGRSVPPTKCSFLPSLPGAQNWATYSPSSSPPSSHASRSCSRWKLPCEDPSFWLACLNFTWPVLNLYITNIEIFQSFENLKGIVDPKMNLIGRTQRKRF